MLTESLLQKKESIQKHGHNFIYVSALPMGKALVLNQRKSSRIVVFTVDRNPCELEYN